jgi:hypothetical protein
VMGAPWLAAGTWQWGSRSNSSSLFCVSGTA